MKKKLLLLLTLAFVTLNITACTGKDAGTASNETDNAATQTEDSPSGEKTTINVGVTAGSYVNHISEIEDFFAEEFDKDQITVNFQVFESASNALTALEAGDLDIASTGDTPLLLAIGSGKNLQVIGQEYSAPDASAIMVSSDSTISDVAELKGKKVGAFVGSAGHAFLLQALNEANLTVDDIELVNLSPVDVPNALANGEIDAAVFTYQFIYAAEQSGEAKILRDSTGLYRFSLIYSANTSFLENYPDLAKRFLKADYRAQKYIDNNRDASYDSIATAAGMDRGLYDRFGFAFYPKFTEDDYQEIRSMADYLSENGLLESEIDVDSIYNLTFLEDAIKEVDAE